MAKQTGSRHDSMWRYGSDTARQLSMNVRGRRSSQPIPHPMSRGAQKDPTQGERWDVHQRLRAGSNGSKPGESPRRRHAAPPKTQNSNWHHATARREAWSPKDRSEEHTSELQSPMY